MSEDYGLGRILLWGSKRVPQGWMRCEGLSLPISEYEQLFELIGNTFGGDGRMIFALPDLRGRRAVGTTAKARLGEQSVDAAAGSGSPGYLGVDYILNLGSPVGTGDLLGEVAWVPHEKASNGWLPCDGRLLPTSEHQFLAAHLGKTYGGDGSHFALPDLRDRTVVGAGRNLPTGKTGSVPVGTGGKPPLGRLALTPRLRTHGTGATEKMVGAITWWAAADFPLPEGWLECRGQVLEIVRYRALHSLLGNTFGGDGKTTFALPDLGGRAAMGGAAAGPQVGDAGGFGGGSSGQVQYLSLRPLIAVSGAFA